METVFDLLWIPVFAIWGYNTYLSIQTQKLGRENERIIKAMERRQLMILEQYEIKIKSFHSFQMN